MMLDRFPRHRLAHLPTPFEHLDRLSAKLGGPEIWIKRDDCTGLSTGGNKTRKLEFLMAEAELSGAETVITQGGIQSNHARQTAAFAAKLGLSCHLVLDDRTGPRDPGFATNGNVLLDHLHGATIETRPSGLDMHAELDAAANRIRNEGRNVYVIPGGGSNATGALGYVSCAYELMDQLHDRSLAVDHIIHATGSGGTQAGLVAGLRARNEHTLVLGISVSAPKSLQEEKVLSITGPVTEKMGCPGVVADSDVVTNDTYVGDGYGIPTEAALEAISMFAQLEGILLDPVYSAKAAAGMIDLIRTGQFTKGQRIVFLHTGGSTALFSYDATLNAL